MPKVSVVRCDSYDESAVKTALTQALDAIGGLDFVRSGMRIGIKANLVSYMKPEQAATTHPAVLCALTKMLKERGAEVVIGDSPGGLYNAAYVGRIYSATGMKACEAAGALLNSNFGEKHGSNPEALVAKELTYTAWLDDCDALINVCKLKSHGMMSMTAAVKNLFGTIPGTMKPEYHFKYPDERDFANMLIDLNLFFKPVLCIADAVVGMEGNGPTAGTPRKLGAILAATNPFYMDLACARIIGVGLDNVPTLRLAHERGLAPAALAPEDICGNLEEFAVKDFKNILTHHSLSFAGNGRGFAALRGRFLRKILSSKPAVHKKTCVGCGVCARTCPAHAITMRGGKPDIDRGACIRCFCCQEFCPKGAMVVHRPPIAKLLNKGATHEQ